MSLAQKYKKSFKEQWALRFKTTHPDGDSYDGVVTHIRRDFIVLREKRDFEFDGVVILPKRVVKGYRDNRFEECCNQILRQNGAIKKAHAPRWLDECDSLPAVLAEIQRRDIWPGLEIVFDDGRESAFYLGPIIELGKESLWLNGYDAAGKWEKVYKLVYAEIFRIEFDSKYCNHFNRYMKMTNPPKLYSR